MESLPQELIDNIIDNIPHSSLRSCSSVARRWRRSQERLFAWVLFGFEGKLDAWCTDIPQDPGGIPSYVHFVRFRNITSWDEPELFGRVLKKFTSMTMLWITNTRIPRPDRVLNSVPFGEFGKKVECLMLCSPRYTAATITSSVLLLLNLEDFLLSGTVWDKPLVVLPPASRRSPLKALQLYASDSTVGTALARCGLTSCALSLVIYEPGLEQLLTLSSDVIVELGLSGRYSLRT